MTTDRKPDSVTSHCCPATMVVRSLRERPGDWSGDQYKLTHNPTGLVLWVANGISFLAADESSKVPFRVGWIGAIKAWFAYCKWANRRFCKLFSDSLSQPTGQRRQSPGTKGEL